MRKVPDHLHSTLKHKAGSESVHREWSAVLPEWLQELQSEIPMRAGMTRWIPELMEVLLLTPWQSKPHTPMSLLIRL